MRVVELVQPVTDAQIGDVALVMRDNLPAMVDFKQAVEDFSADLLTTTTIYASRSEAQAASIPAAQNTLRLYHDGQLLEYKRDASGTAIITDGGDTWSPVGSPSPAYWGAFRSPFAGPFIDATAELQAAINWAKATASTQYLPRDTVVIDEGTYAYTSLLIDRPVTITGKGGSGASRLFCTSGGAGITIAVAHDGYDYPAATSFEAVVDISGVMIHGPSVVTGSTHGLTLQNAASNPLRYLLRLTDVNIFNFPGDGINAEFVSCAVIGFNVNIRKVGRDGIRANSANDCSFHGGSVCLAGGNGIAMSGCGEWNFWGVLVFSNTGLGIQSFNSKYQFHGGMLDRNGNGGLRHDSRDIVRQASFFGTSFLLNTNDDIRTDFSSISNTLRLSNCTFDEPGVGVGASTMNIRVIGSGVISADNCMFGSSDIPTPTYVTPTTLVSHSLTIGNTSRSLVTLPGPYGDDTAAIAAGLTSGAAYRQTGAGIAYVGGASGGDVVHHVDGNRDTLTEFIDAGRGNDGLAWGLRADGSVEIFDQTVTPPTERDTATEYLPVITDNTGAVAMGLTEDGLPVALEWVQHVDGNRDRVADGVAVISGRDGVAMSMDPETGLLRNGAPFTGPMYYPPSDMRGNWGQFHVRPGGTHTYATVQTRGYICDVMQRLDLKVRNTAVAVDDIETWLVIGQSNSAAGSGAVGGPPITVSDWPHHVLDCGLSGVYGGSTAEVFMDAAYDLRPATEPSGYGQSPSMMLGLALADLEHNDGERVPARVTFTSWEGGRNLSDFFPGAGRFIHENAVFGLEAMHRVCAQGYVAPTLTAVLFVQGENSTAGYQAEFESWIDGVLPLYGDAVAQPTPHLLFRQINIGSDASALDANDVAGAQLAVARDRLGDGVTLTGPMYHLPLHDNIHADNLGRMMGGEMDAHAWRVQQGGDNWHPLWPVAGGVTRVGAVITIPMVLPPGCYEMLFDDDWVPTTPNRGFVYSDASSGATISTVEIDGANIVITLSADPGAAASKTIRYAQYNPPQVVGWAGARGQLYCDTYAPSPYYLRGFAVPPTIRAYCARFTETLV